MRRDDVTFWLPGIEWSGAATAVEPADAEERRRALDPETSFIVQAPAGSGKTELLIQRFLVLLARVEQPESIVAITFTVKAAGEMRSRVLEALKKARANAEPQSAHERLTRELAAAALDRDRRLGWKLLDNPDRLRIQTIDALCMAITRQMPWLARFGAMPNVTEDARAMYAQAAQRALESLGTPDETGAAAECIVTHLDNNVAGASTLLARMLETRDHWLRVTGFRRDLRGVRETLEAALSHTVCEHLTHLRAALPEAHAGELLELARYAGSNLREGPIAVCASLSGIPGACAGDVAAWSALCSLLLTGKGEWRQKPDRRVGFPPSDRRRKDRFTSLLERFASEEEFRLLLAAVPELPACRYTEPQWNVLAALFRLLPVTVAHLRTVFSEAGKVDFVEIAASARRALAESDQPTDLALSMGSRIEHLLIDEFQDTSVTQFELLLALTAGWEDGTGRTLFLVGDPMQSIYRFRQAEVGLFLNVQHSGVAALQPEPLPLSVNFRSARPVVDWVNETFRAILPEAPDPYTGAVPFASAVAFREGSADAGVEFHPLIGRDDDAEAELVLDLIDAESRAADGGIAVLVRSRTHLALISERLRERGIAYRAIEIQALAEKPVIQDLLALTRALLHLGDRAAWLSILRAPWCGLTLADLHRIASPDPKAAVWDLLNRPDLELSGDGALRHASVKTVLAGALAKRGRVPVVQLVEDTWTSLGAHRLLDAYERSDARAFLDILDETGAHGDIGDFEALSARVVDLFASPAAGSEAAVELMTIHKAKGLEFDTVVLPGLGKPPRRDDPALLMWSERPVDGATELLMAPIPGSDEREDTTYRFIRHEQAKKTRYESQRLLYVACTRAKRRLHLIGHAEVNAEGVLSDPNRESLLAHLWNAVKPAFESRMESEEARPPAELPARTPRTIRRVLPDELPNPAVEPRLAALPSRASAATREDDTLRRIGTMTHRMLEHIAREGVERWALERIETLGAVLDPDIADRVRDALLRTLADERGRWILAKHEEAHSEFAVSAVVRGSVRHFVLDRTFVDENGIRWIIDYKTAEAGPPESERSDFHEQLQRYAEVIRGLDSRPVRVGLYFVATSDWIEWSPF